MTEASKTESALKTNKTLWIVLGVIAAFIAIVVTVVVSSYISAYNYGNNMDNQLIAIKENNRNIYAQGTQAILEIAQVPSMYKNDFVEIIKADIEGRYGKTGSQATLQFIKEHDIKMDTVLYASITDQIKAFRAKFEVNQTRMIDVKRSYNTTLGSFWSGLWLRLAGYPKINLNEYVAVTTDATEQVFKDGKEKGPLKLR